MREEGYITAREEDEARRAPLRLRPPPREGRAEAGYARQYLREQFRALFGGDHPPGWKVYTTFDPRLQAAAERAVMRGLARLRARGLQAALVALRPEDGAIVALVGGRDFARSEFDRATRARRQPGSAFKPFVYAAALERGFTPVTLLQQATQVPVPGTGDWTPRNVSHTSGAALALREAFIESNNRAAVGVQLAVGSRAIRGLASEAGMPDMPDVASLALGTGLVSPLQLTSAYAIFVNGGFSVEPHGIARIVDGDGEASWEMAPRSRRVISAETAFQMISLMRDVLERGTGAAARSLGVVFPAGGKTGTTNDGHDAWFVGFTSSLVAGVWVGHDEPRPMGPGASGARYALPIWADFMIEAARVLPAREFTPPSSLHEETLCRMSYRRATRACPAAYREYFKDASEAPRELCELHRRPSLGERVSDALRGWWDRLRGVFR
jgi:penicillin-binding protein 1A